MLIESNFSEILLNVFPVYSIAPDNRIFPAPVLFTMGWDHHVYICSLWHFIVTTRRVPRVLTVVFFVYQNSNNKLDQKTKYLGSLRKVFSKLSSDCWLVSDESSVSLVSSGL